MNVPTVLVVDDEVALAELYREFLEERGFQVSLAYTGREAIEHLRSGNSVDYLLLDLVMPRLDGWDVLRFLQESCPACQPSVIVISGSDFRADLRRFPAVSFLEKPFPIDHLFRLMESNKAAA